VKTAFEIAGPVLICGPIIAAFIRCFCTSESEEEQ
jgi:hypothetical protein